MSTPKWPLKWLSRIWLPELVEHMEGDLAEIYEDRLERYSPIRARLLFYRDCLQLLRPYLFKPLFNGSKTNIMITNHFKIGYRNLLKYRNYSLINLLGLTLGLAASIILYRVVAFENSYDKFHAKAANLYILAEESVEYGKYYQTRTPAAGKLEETLPEVINSSRFFQPDSKWLTEGTKKLQPAFTYVDPGIEEMLSFEVLEGDMKAALTTPDNIVLSLSVSKSFFGYENALGKILTTVDGKHQYVVGAVVNDFPFNSSFEFEVLASWEYHIPKWVLRAGNWHNTFMTALIELQEGVSPDMIRDKLNQVSKANFLPEGDDSVFYPVSLENFYSEFVGNQNAKNLLLIISAVISFIAFINFVNLSTAQSLNRIKEVAIRKVMGSMKSELMTQFAVESVIICLVSVVLALVISALVTPQINEYFDMGLENNWTQIVSMTPWLLGVAVLMGLVAALYPSLYLTGNAVVSSLKGDAKKGSRKMIIQKSLIILQYMASIVLIAGTLVIWRQLDFMKSQSLNVETDRIVILNLDYSSFGGREKGKQAVQRLAREARLQSFIESVAHTEKAPGAYSDNYNNFRDVANANSDIHLRQITFSPDVVPTLQMEVVKGRNFSPDLASDSSAVLINEAAYKAFGWEDLENKSLRPSGNDDTYRVVGVVKDYHYKALIDNIEPMIHWNMGNDGTGWQMIVRYAPGQAEAAIEYLKNIWTESGSFIALDYYFLDQAYNDLYRDQERNGSLATSFAILAIALASLGLFALASYLIRQRRKEIGIRKVVGASAQRITLFLTRGFMFWVLIAMFLAVPVIWYAVREFLSRFAYRIDPGFDIYLLSGLIALGLAFTSVGLRSFVAASDNPVESLRDE